MAQPILQQGELRDIEASLIHLRQGAMAGWFARVWIKLSTYLTEEPHGNKDIGTQTKMLIATITIAGVFLNYAEKYGPEYGRSRAQRINLFAYQHSHASCQNGR